MSKNEDLYDRDYLGDGVYAGHDGYQVVVWLEFPGGYEDAVALEPPVLARLVEYARRVGLAGRLAEIDGGAA